MRGIASAARGGWSAERCSALTRRYVGVDDGFVNCGPSRRYVWPVLAPAEGIVRAGAVLRERGGSRAGLCSSCAGRALLGCLVLVRAHHTFLPKCFMLDHACCLPHERQTGRLAICSVPVPPWVVIAGSAFSNRRCGYRAFLVHFGRARFLVAIPTENEETRERGERSRRRDRVRFCVIISALSCFPRGVRWGLRAPKPAPKSLRLSGLSSFGS